MRPQRVDDLASRLAAAVSRRRTLVLIAGALAPRPAAARSDGKRERRRCRRREAVAVRGQCRCAWIGDGERSDFPCQVDPSCLCVLTAEGTGYCTRPPLPGAGQCHSSADCPPGAACILTTNGVPVCTGPCHPPT